MVTILIDDLRSFRDGREAIVLRTGAEALAALREFDDQHVGELWLDHDLGGNDTIRPVVRYLEERAFNGHPLSVDRIYVHTANAAVAQGIVKGLTRYGYPAQRVGTEALISGPVPAEDDDR